MTQSSARRRADAAETTEGREARLARERELIEEARASFRNGDTMDEAEVEAWLDGLDGDEDLPLPEVRRGRPARP